MSERTHARDVTRYTLQSFVGPRVADLSITKRQKDAIQRLIGLSDEKFEALCDDIVNEIHRRGGMNHSTDGPMHEKLAELSEEKFRSLAVDTLLVYNYRNPGTEVLELDSFLNNLQQLISDLKTRSDEERFVERIRGMGFLNAMLEYNRYVERTGTMDKEVTAEIERLIKQEVESRSTKLIECLSYPADFIRCLDREAIKDSPEYKYHRANIMRLIENTPEVEAINEEYFRGTKATGGLMGETKMFSNVEFSRSMSEAEIANRRTLERPGEEQAGMAIGKTARSRLIKVEMLQMLTMFVEKSCVPAAKLDAQYPEIQYLAKSLDAIYDDLNGNTCVNVKEMSTALIELLDGLLGKLSIEQDVGGKEITTLKLHRVSIENLGNSTTKLEAFRQIVFLVRDVTKILSSI